MSKHKHGTIKRHIEDKDIEHHTSPKAKVSEPVNTASGMWIMISLVLGVLLVASIFTHGFDFRSDIDKTQEGLGKVMSKTESEAQRNSLNQALTVLTSLKAASKPGTTGTGGSALVGGSDAKVTVEVFSDFECPFCARGRTTVDQMRETYGDDVNIVFKNFPLSFHPNAQLAAEAGECAEDQGKFWAFHDKLFDNQKALSADNYKRWAGELGLDVTKFSSCLDNGEKKSVVSADMAEGQQKGVSGTPTFFINGYKVVGAQPFETFKPLIDKALAGEKLEQAPPAAPQAPPAPTIATVGIDDDPMKGDEDAPVTIIEFSDFQCPFCARFYDQTLSQIMEEYVDTGKVRFVYRDFPLSFHAEAKPSAIAAECADEQGKFWEFHDKVYENQDTMNAASYKAWAEELGLDMAEFESCLADPKMAAEVDKDFADGQKAGNSGTPGFFIGVTQDDGNIQGSQIKGAQPFANFKALIDQKLAEAEE